MQTRWSKFVLKISPFDTQKHRYVPYEGVCLVNASNNQFKQSMNKKLHTEDNI